MKTLGAAVSAVLMSHKLALSFEYIYIYIYEHILSTKKTGLLHSVAGSNSEI